MNEHLLKSCRYKIIGRLNIYFDICNHSLTFITSRIRNLRVGGKLLKKERETVTIISNIIVLSLVFLFFFSSLFDMMLILNYTKEKDFCSFVILSIKVVYMIISNILYFSLVLSNPLTQEAVVTV